MKNGNKPAMPTRATIDRKEGECIETQVEQNEFMLFGLTKREHFACEMLSGLLVQRDIRRKSELVELAVGMADALLEGLNK